VLPKPGVYVYATEGGEEIDAFGGSSHKYPDRTTITMKAGDCGRNARWDVLEERWEEWVLCARNGGVVQPRFSSHQEFFRQSSDQHFTCDPNAYLLPPNPHVPQRWGYQCRSEQIEVDMAVSTLGTREATVGGTRLTVCRVHLVVTFSGETSGRLEEEDWFVCDSGLLVWRDSATASDSESPVGRVHYEERYTLKLQSLKPLT
jgi:hypothetical protein